VVQLTVAVFYTERYNAAEPPVDQGVYLNILGIVNEKVPHLLQY
jgi:hypothetical protein